jgi:methylthioribose-1-phosphate isomerase
MGRNKGSGVQPFRVSDEQIDILDQRWLPHRVEYLHARTAADVIAAIQNLAVRGAPAIAIVGLYGLWLEARRLWRDNQGALKERLVHAKAAIESSRPTAVNLANALNVAWSQLREVPDCRVPDALREMADQLVHQEEARNRHIADSSEWVWSKFSRPIRVLTHCNTGSLATVGEGTALGAIRRGFQRGIVRLVWVDETRPLLQGARLTAWELCQDQIPATLIVDSAAGALMRQGLVDAVMVGADRIALNGDTANKIGTYSLAVLASFHHIPFYVVAPLTTVDRRLETGQAIPIEERDGQEVRAVQGTRVAPADIAVKNPAFDVTDASLIDAIITDRGVIYPPYYPQLARILEEDHNA